MKKDNVKPMLITTIIVVMITVILLFIMQIIVVKTKEQLLEERFKTSSEMLDMRCREIELSVKDWNIHYEEYIDQLCYFISEIDRIPFTFGAVYDKELNVISERTFFVEVSDDPLDPLCFPEVVTSLQKNKYGIENVLYPVILHDGSTKYRLMRIYFRRIPQVNDYFVIACIAQPFDESLIELPEHYMKLIYTIVGIIGVSICLFIVMFFRYFFSGKRFPFNSMEK